MNYHWITDLEPYKGTPFYKNAIKVFSKLTANPLWKYLGKEDHLQIKVAIYMSSTYPEVLMHHSPNEGKRSPIEQLRVKYFGVKALPDVMIYAKKTVATIINPSYTRVSAKYYGLAIELKIKPNKCSVNQAAILKQLENAGYKTAVCYTLKEVIDMINDYLG